MTSWSESGPRPDAPSSSSPITSAKLLGLATGSFSLPSALGGSSANFLSICPDHVRSRMAQSLGWRAISSRISAKRSTRVSSRSTSCSHEDRVTTTRVLCCVARDLDRGGSPSYMAALPRSVAGRSFRFPTGRVLRSQLLDRYRHQHETYCHRLFDFRCDRNSTRLTARQQ